MSSGLCGRPAAPGPDSVCICHDPSPAKDGNQFWAAVKASSVDNRSSFQEDYDCTNFVFPTFDGFSIFEDKRVIFTEASFLKGAHFKLCRFKAFRFESATFSGPLYFADAHADALTFSSVTFEDCVVFARSSVGDADFMWAKFKKRVVFRSVTFSRSAYFFETTLGDEAIFDDVVFGQRESRPCSDRGVVVANFRNAHFVQPKLVDFARINESERVHRGFRASFLNTDIEFVRFTDIAWHRNKAGELVLEDEYDLEQQNNNPEAKSLYGETTDELVTATYRRLCKNFDNSRQYDLAEDCYVGSMRVKAKSPRTPLSQKVIYTLYNWLSAYGSSYTRAATMLLSIVVVFILIFPLHPVGVQLASSPASAPLYWPMNKSPRDWSRTMAASISANLAIVSLSKNPVYLPASTLGKNLALVEAPLVALQTALLFLALGRRFKR